MRLATLHWHRYNIWRTTSGDGSTHLWTTELLVVRLGIAVPIAHVGMVVESITPAKHDDAPQHIVSRVPWTRERSSTVLHGSREHWFSFELMKKKRKRKRTCDNSCYAAGLVVIIVFINLTVNYYIVIILLLNVFCLI